MPKTIVELCTNTMRKSFAGALAQTRLNNSPKSQIFSLLGGGISSLQRLLYNDEDSIKENGKPLLSNSETVRLIEEVRFAFNLVINGQLELLRDEQDMDFSDRFAYVDEWYDYIQNDWRDFLKLHKELVAGLIAMYNARLKSDLAQMDSPDSKRLQACGLVEMSEKEAIAFSKVTSSLSKMKDFALGSGIYKDVKDHIVEVEKLVEEL